MTPREIARTIEKCLDGCDVPEANRCALVDCVEQAIERERDYAASREAVLRGDLDRANIESFNLLQRLSDR